MRIMVSGTHSVGKSTFVKDFLAAHPEYTLEDEPYRALCDFHDIKFGKDATCFCNSLQLYYNISRTKQYVKGDNVIFDRCPVDYIPYSIYPARYGQSDINDAYVEQLIKPVREALAFVDLLVFVPITDKHLVEIEDDGIRLIDPSYRAEVDQSFKDIYRDKLFDVMPATNPPKYIEIWGSREQRLAQLNELL